MSSIAADIRFDLRLHGDQVEGTHEGVDDLALCVDTAGALASIAQTWANPGKWTGIGGFDADGCITLVPGESETLHFKRSPRAYGWLKNPGDEDSEGWFIPSHPKPEYEGPMEWPVIYQHMTALPGFYGCALRHPQTGLWKPVIANDQETRFSALRVLITPMLKILRAQGLPYGRCLIAGTRGNALLWRTPAKVIGYLHLHSSEGLAEAEALVDAALLSTSKE